jgi:hypothetical protein
MHLLQTHHLLWQEPKWLRLSSSLNSCNHDHDDGDDQQDVRESERVATDQSQQPGVKRMPAVVQRIFESFMTKEYVRPVILPHLPTDVCRFSTSLSLSWLCFPPVLPLIHRQVS